MRKMNRIVMVVKKMYRSRRLRPILTKECDSCASSLKKERRSELNIKQTKQSNECKLVIQAAAKQPCRVVSRQKDPRS